MTQFYSTRQVAGLLNIKPDTLQKAIWQNRVQAPMKGPSGQYLWVIEDIERASWALLRRSYEPAQVNAARRGGPVHISVAAAEAMKVIEQRRRRAVE